MLNLQNLLHFGEGKTFAQFILQKTKPRPLFPNTEDLKEINIYFADHCINQHNTILYFDCQLHFKLSGETMASKPKKEILKLKLL